jgi:predicted PurR-regulated permease PerM
MNTNKVKVIIPTNQVLKVLAILSLLFLMVNLQSVIILLFLSFILMASTLPATIFLHKRFRIPRALSVMLVYILIFIAVAVSIYFISKPLIAESKTLSDNAHNIVDGLVKQFPALEGKINGASLTNALRGFFADLSQGLSKVIDFTFNAFDAFLDFISVIIIAIYLYLDRELILDFFVKVFKLKREKFLKNYESIEVQLGAWVRGQLMLGFIVGSMTWIGLTILDVKFVLPLAVLAGIFEIIPIIGPVISAVPITLIGFTSGVPTGLLCLGLCIIVQQVENNLLVPGIMKKAVGLSPVVTLVSIVIGKVLFGLLGSIIAVPVAAILYVLLNIYLEEREIKLDQKEA